MAHKKGGGTTKKNRDSAGRRLGVKIYGSQVATPGSIVVRQKGTKFYPGNGTQLGRDHTIFAIRKGTVIFRRKIGKTVIDVI
ncbi:50S ribosomal protein L27 [Candidatus Curtissbacteria bacterium RIFCSPHIGHO2_01_FULL_41_13]|uniref:Large ribosomal subunit protein bL27 n=1 Tax=Candidatus Curtissbacteria bacterium RIFCSPHIGHO2_01_FULL_41_13 TaxID=1797745 RepID=A0A1F5FY88_9BACT|nr:MAG: 50S ribosomal protein L27 [Candidatus Curtissbacteria bacterium RIFCSPHIGHO2_01_FULL_41_13]